MKNKEILLYHTNKVLAPEPSNLDFQIWKPSIKKLIPPGKPKRYLLYTVFQYLKVFKNNNYSYFELKIGGKKAASFLVVPSYFKWKFMSPKSVQFTYVMTDPEFRGQGLAWKGIYTGYQQLVKNGVTDFWYVTDTENLASQKLAKKMGFKLIGKGIKRTNYFGLISTLNLK